MIDVAEDLPVVIGPIIMIDDDKSRWPCYRCHNGPLKKYDERPDLERYGMELWRCTFCECIQNRAEK